MQEPPIPDDEAKRLELLRACNIIYTPAEESFDEVARLAADLCGSEIALITLVDADYQWFKARVGRRAGGNGARPVVLRSLREPSAPARRRRYAPRPAVLGQPAGHRRSAHPLLRGRPLARRGGLGDRG